MADKVDFFIAGVQKGGTTALDAMLRSHPSIQMASKKEVHFFDNDDLDWETQDYSLLHKHFDWSRKGLLRGEATPIYTYWPGSLERLAAYNPAAKIIVCLRHPAFRAHSHWRMEVKRGRDNQPFADAIRSGRQRFRGAHRIFSYVERGFYSEQIKRTKDLFREVHFLRTDHQWSNTGRAFEQLCSFLGIPPKVPPRRYIVPLDTAGSAQPINPDDFAFLSNLYNNDIQTTALLTQLDLDDWLDQSYSEPMVSEARRYQRNSASTSERS